MEAFYRKILEYAFLLNKLSVSPSEITFNTAKKVRKELKNIVVKENGINGVYWWNVPIDEVLFTMNENIVGEYDENGWRIASDYRYDFTDSGIELYIEEEGHYSNFSSSRNVEYSTISRYSEAEREEMVSNFNKRIDAREQWNIATTDGMVYSERYDKLYDSARSYYNSVEHRLDRQLDSDFYASTLVNEKKTTTTMVYSNSIHYKSLFSIAEFLVDPSGNVVMFGFHEPEKISAVGSGNEYSGQGLINKSSRVLFADYLMNDPRVKKIGINLLDRIFFAECSNYTEALYNAAMIAKLGQKLYYVEFTGSDGCFTEEQAIQCNQLFQKVSSGVQLNEAETISLLNAVINGGLKLEYLNVIWIKTALLYDLTVMNAKDFSRCDFYSTICADIVNVIFTYIKNDVASKQLAEFAVATSAICTESRLEQEQYAECFKYADMLGKYLDILENTDSYSEILKSSKMYRKLLKKVDKCKIKLKKRGIIAD